MIGFSVFAAGSPGLLRDHIVVARMDASADKALGIAGEEAPYSTREHPLEGSSSKETKACCAEASFGSCSGTFTMASSLAEAF